MNPLLKKGAKNTTHKNLRPVSNLQFVSKITERAMFDQVYNHVTVNELFPGLQSAYRKSHSTETAQVKIVNGILLNMNRQHVSLLVLLDLSAAFDTVDHTILLRRLEPDSSMEETEARCAMERCLRAVRAWMIIDKLKLNEEKTDFMLIGTRQQLVKVRRDSLLVGDTNVPPVNRARNLGVWFDSNFQFHSHINKTCQSAFYYYIILGVLENICHWRLQRPWSKLWL